MMAAAAAATPAVINAGPWPGGGSLPARMAAPAMRYRQKTGDRGHDSEYQQSDAGGLQRGAGAGQLNQGDTARHQGQAGTEPGQ